MNGSETTRNRADAVHVENSGFGFVAVRVDMIANLFYFESIEILTTSWIPTRNVRI
jgi:hypothetical protein